MQIQSFQETEYPEMLQCEETMDLEGVKHGFFTRRGGVSPAPYDSLNCGYGSNDDAENVSANRNHAMKVFAGADESVLCTLYQTHSTDVIPVTEGFGKDQRQEGDAMVTKTPGVVLGILTADCGPVLFADAKNKVVGAAHAGWKGAVYGILENTVNAMEALGAERKYIHAIIGPCIYQESYEVGPEFHEKVLAEISDGKAFFAASQNREGHFQFDLPGFIRFQLEKAGIHSICQVNADTCKERERFFSYRRNTLENVPDYGRGMSVIRLDTISS